MRYTTNIKGSTLLLSRFLFYIVMPISLMGAMMPGGGPPNDPYVRAYDTLEADYIATNQNTNQLIINYSNRLSLAMTSIRDGAQDALLWAQRQEELARIDSNMAGIIRRRIAIMLGHIAEHATNAQGRSAAVQAGVPGAAAAVLPGDQAILDAFNQAEVINQDAEEAFNRSQDAVNEIQNNFINGHNGINNRLNAIQQRIINPPIFGINYTNADVLAYNQALTAIKNDSNYINQRAFAAMEYALRAHNALNDIRQLMLNVVALGNNLNIPLPPY